MVNVIDIGYFSFVRLGKKKNTEAFLIASTFVVLSKQKRD